ncbi:hypothetical protein B0A49_03268 [Cryomyces minteri]|uniref:Uncharacterized protein n=1 Tax=Cryomyces minteri TaxID=331657 RepID=A0A4V6WL50_9PEZI|nr:hypothetical protein B0A49_03268 [Cryomyces minteri]
MGEELNGHYMRAGIFSAIFSGLGLLVAIVTWLHGRSQSTELGGKIAEMPGEMERRIAQAQEEQRDNVRLLKAEFDRFVRDEHKRVVEQLKRREREVETLREGRDAALRQVGTIRLRVLELELRLAEG